MWPFEELGNGDASLNGKPFARRALLLCAKTFATHAPVVSGHQTPELRVSGSSRTDMPAGAAKPIGSREPRGSP